MNKMVLETSGEAVGAAVGAFRERQRVLLETLQAEIMEGESPADLMKSVIILYNYPYNPMQETAATKRKASGHMNWLRVLFR